MPGFRFYLPFRRLQWRLTFSYVMVTLLGVVAIEIVGLAILAHAIWHPIQDQLLYSAEIRGRQAAMCMESASPKNDALSALLNADVEGMDASEAKKDWNGAISIHMNEKLSTALIDRNGLTVEASFHAPWSTGDRVAPNLSSSEALLLRRALIGDPACANTATSKAGRMVFAAVPIRGRNGRILGALISRLSIPCTTARLLRAEAGFLLPTATMVAIFAAFFGTIFGFLTARRLTSRLDNIATAADAWSRGEFARSASDSVDDELGDLARRLDLMAGQLEEHFQLRENLAAAEERNRLARDLHDTVKQQAFASAMHIGAAQSLADRDISTTRKHLDEASRLVHDIQQDLSGIIRELRPPASECDGIETAIRNYASDWSRQTGVAAQLEFDRVDGLPQAVEETLFRIVQGALSNTARHSKASAVEIQLRHVDRRKMVLSIADNGIGFDPSTIGTGGVGLRILRERAEALPNGDFHLENGFGTRIEIEFSAFKENGDG